MCAFLLGAAKLNFASTAEELWARSGMANGITLNKPNMQHVLGKTFYVFKTTKLSPSGSNDSKEDNMGNNNAEKATGSSVYELINFSLRCKNLYKKK